MQTAAPSEVTPGRQSIGRVSAARATSAVAGLRKALRAPRTIVIELVAIAGAGVVSTAIPQDPLPAERLRFAVEHPWLAGAVRALGLDRVFGSEWFLALVGVAAGSLAIVLVEQWKRLFREWGMPPSEASFRAAPMRVEFDRAAQGATTRIARRHVAGMLGSPLFHLGLMTVVLAGVGRMLFGAEAAVRLYEGEILPARAEAFDVRWTGLLATPVALESPVELLELTPELYPSGALRFLSARVAIRADSTSQEHLAINSPLDDGSERLYLSSRHGCAAFVQVESRGGSERRAAMLEEGAVREFVTTETFPDELELRLLARVGPAGERPEAVDFRALRRGATLAAGMLRPGEEVQLPDGGRVALVALRYWARFTASRDFSTWPAYVGFALALLGATLMFAFVKVDTAVIVTPIGDRERVIVAMRPQRLAPLFRSDFERLVRDEGGPGQEE